MTIDMGHFSGLFLDDLSYFFFHERLQAVEIVASADRVDPRRRRCCVSEFWLENMGDLIAVTPFGA